MSFFFVLSGFVMMHAHHNSSFVTLQQKREFWFARWKKIYPSYILNLSFYIPTLFITALDLKNHCVYQLYCSLMQVFFLNSWAGCGCRHTINVVSWYIATLSWIWFAFPFIHGMIKVTFEKYTWIKMLCVNIISVLMILPFHEYEVFTLCTLPILRLGEFVIGCGISFALKQQEFESMSFYKWLPLICSVTYLITVYTVLALPHGMDWLCLHEEMQSHECKMWQPSEWVEASPPCFVVWDKYFNKHALLWAVIIYTVAFAEKCSDHGVLIQALNHDVFKTLSSFSISLYLGHDSIKHALKSITNFAGFEHFWHDDTILIAIYLLCYVLHLITQKLTFYLFK
jgi:peptidoglycan/LPS O-acetylase OafA/YrhL